MGVYKTKFNVVLDYKFSLQKELQDYNLTEGIDNLDETPNESGTPEWHVFSLNSNYFLDPYITIQLQVQNILDVHYKEFGSSISSPGRNVSASLAYSF